MTQSVKSEDVRLLLLLEEDVGWWVKLRECGELLYGRRSTLRLKGAAYELCKASN